MCARSQAAYRVERNKMRVCISSKLLVSRLQATGLKSAHPHCCDFWAAAPEAALSIRLQATAARRVSVHALPLASSREHASRLLHMMLVLRSQVSCTPTTCSYSAGPCAFLSPQQCSIIPAGTVPACPCPGMTPPPASRTHPPSTS